MKYQYTDPQQQSTLKKISLRLFLIISLIGVVYEGYKFVGSAYFGSNSLIRGPDKYCGNSTCYQLLGVDRSANQDQIKKSFRLLARKHHPDKSTQKNAIEFFQQFSKKILRILNKAYQTLIDEKSRFIYDMYLRNPQQSEYARQFEYYNQKYIGNPQIPVSVVILGIIICISALQYVMRKQMYQKAIKQISQSHDFKIKVNERCAGNKKDKETIRQQMMSEIEIEGGLAKPRYQDIFGYKILILPWTLVLWAKSWVVWIVCYWILRQQYESSAQEYLTKKSLEISETKWKNLAEEQKKSLLSKKLWIQQNKISFINQKRRQWLEELRVKNPSRYHSVVKYMRQNNIKID